MKLHYSILSKSSSDVNYPISNLITDVSHWQSSKFCEYPQQITIKFYQPVIINKIKVIVHAYKVMKKINILYHLPVLDNQNQFYKLGYLQFKQPKQQKQNNLLQNPQISQLSKSKVPKLRQLKVINNLQIKAQYLRLIVSQNYKHSTNVYNQVALCSLIIQGSSYKVQTIPIIKLKNNSFLQIKQFVNDKIDKLNQFKQNCIKRQQYNQAKQIKNIINQVNILLKSMQELNQTKIQQIKKQNYNQAKLIKDQIQKIKFKIQQISNNFYDPNNKQIKTFNIEKYLKIKNKKNQQQKNNIQNNKDTNSFQNQFIQDELSLSHVIHQQNQNQHSQQQNKASQSRVSYSQKVIPALINKIKGSSSKLLSQNVSQNSYQQNYQQNLSKSQLQIPSQPEQISPSNQANASILAQFFQKIIIRKLHSKYWQFKNQAMEKIKQDCKQNQHNKISKNRFKAYLFVYNRILSKQNHKILIQSAFDIMNMVAQMNLKQIQQKNQMINELQKAVIQTLNRLQENSILKSKAEKAIIKIIQSKIFGNSIVYHAILRSYNQRLNPKIKKIYLQNLQYIVSKNHTNIKNILPITIVDFTVKKLNDPNNQVRKAAVNLLKSLKQAGYKDRIKICISEEDSLKQSYLKELNIV